MIISTKIVSDLQDYAKQVKPELKEINVTEAIERFMCKSTGNLRIYGWILFYLSA